MQTHLFLPCCTLLFGGHDDIPDPIGIISDLIDFLSVQNVVVIIYRNIVDKKIKKLYINRQV